MPIRLSPHLGLLLVALFWGANFSFVKVALREIPPLAFTGIRFGLGAVLLWWVVRRVEGEVPLPKGAFWPLVALGLIGNTLYQFMFIAGLARTSATSTALILASMPPLVTVAAGLLGIETVARRQLAAVGIATLGVLLVVLARGGEMAGGIRTGDLLILVAVVAWSAYTLGIRMLKLPMSSLQLTAWTMYTGTPILALAGVPEMLRLDWGQVSWAAWGGLVYSLLFALLAAYLLWNRGVRALGASRAAVYTCLTPLIAAAIAVVVLGERPTLFHAAGAALIIGGVLLARGVAPTPVESA